MKKLILTLTISFITLTCFAQFQEKTQRLKYITKAPDGSIAMTIIDDARDANIKLESANNFYKYEILDSKTSEPIYVAHNKGKECAIDKSKIAAGDYKLRLYTSSFVITSKLTVSAKRKFIDHIKNNQTLASVIED